MEKKQRLLIWRDANQLLLEIGQAVRQFSRYHKYAVGADLRRQAMLASYFGHFQHACHYRLVRRIFIRFPWLSCLFSLLGDRLVPLWQPIDVSGYKSQQRFFRRTFPNTRIDIQCGCFFERLPAGELHRQSDNNLRFHVGKAVVRQQGYLKGGLRCRCVESITLPFSFKQELKYANLFPDALLYVLSSNRSCGPNLQDRFHSCFHAE